MTTFHSTYSISALYRRFTALPVLIYLLLITLTLLLTLHYHRQSDHQIASPSLLLPTPSTLHAPAPHSTPTTIITATTSTPDTTTSNLFNFCASQNAEAYEPGDICPALQTDAWADVYPFIQHRPPPSAHDSNGLEDLTH